MRIGLFKVSEKGSIGELLHARCVVSHRVHRPRKVGGQVTVAVLALVGALDIAEVRSCFVAGDGPFGHARHGGRVITTVGDGGVPHIVVRSHDHDLAYLASMLEVTVGDVACRVVGGHQSPLDLLWGKGNLHTCGSPSGQ